MLKEVSSKTVTGEPTGHNNLSALVAIKTFCRTSLINGAAATLLLKILSECGGITSTFDIGTTKALRTFSIIGAASSLLSSEIRKACTKKQMFDIYELN